MRQAWVAGIVVVASAAGLVFSDRAAAEGNCAATRATLSRDSAAHVESSCPEAETLYAGDRVVLDPGGLLRFSVPSPDPAESIDVLCESYAEGPLTLVVGTETVPRLTVPADVGRCNEWLNDHLSCLDAHATLLMVCSAHSVTWLVDAGREGNNLHARGGHMMMDYEDDDDDIAEANYPKIFMSSDLDLWSRQYLAGDHGLVLHNVEPAVSTNRHIYAAFVWTVVQAVVAPDAVGPQLPPELEVHREKLSALHELLRYVVGDRHAEAIEAFPWTRLQTFDDPWVHYLLYEAAVDQRNFDLSSAIPPRMSSLQLDPSFGNIWLRQDSFVVSDPVERVLPLESVQARLKEVENYLLVRPHDIYLLRQKGEILMGLERYEEAAVEFERATRVFPFWAPWDQWMECLVRAGRHDEAEKIAALHATARGHDGDSTKRLTALFLARGLRDAGETAKAQKLLETSLEKWPEDPALTRCQQSLAEPRVRVTGHTAASW